MVESFMKQTALAHLGLRARVNDDDEAGVELAEAPCLGQVGLRLDASDSELREKAETALGFPLPVEANTVTSDEGRAAIWMGPDEWLLLTPEEEGSKLEKALNDALEGHHAAVFDVSDSRSRILLAGRNARDVLKKGCGIDFHPRAFKPGQCAQSTLALAHILVHQVAEVPETGAAAYHLFVHRSFTEYTWAWLEDAAAEYGIRISAE